MLSNAFSPESLHSHWFYAVIDVTQSRYVIGLRTFKDMHFDTDDLTFWKLCRFDKSQSMCTWKFRVLSCLILHAVCITTLSGFQNKHTEISASSLISQSSMTLKLFYCSIIREGTEALGCRCPCLLLKREFTKNDMTCHSKPIQ